MTDEKKKATAKIVGKIVAFPFKVVFRVGGFVLSSMIRTQGEVNRQYGKMSDDRAYDILKGKKSSSKAEKIAAVQWERNKG